MAFRIFTTFGLMLLLIGILCIEPIKEYTNLVNGEKVQEVMANYDNYEAVVSSNYYEMPYSLTVIEYDDYKTVTIHFKDTRKEIVFDLLPNFSYHLKDSDW